MAANKQRHQYRTLRSATAKQSRPRADILISPVLMCCVNVSMDPHETEVESYRQYTEKTCKMNLKKKGIKP